jgi:hypothetical protein
MIGNLVWLDSKGAKLDNPWKWLYSKKGRRR